MKEKLFLIATILLGSLTGIGVGWKLPVPETKEFTIKARRYAFSPPVMKVNYGDTLVFKLVSMDVVHGFYLEGYDIDARVTANEPNFKFRHPSEGDEWKAVETFTVIATRRGKYRYRCSQTCGTLHPFMQGELIVEPNLTYYGGFGGVIGLFVGILIMFSRKEKSGGSDGSKLISKE